MPPTGSFLHETHISPFQIINQIQESPHIYNREFLPRLYPQLETIALMLVDAVRNSWYYGDETNSINLRLLQWVEPFTATLKGNNYVQGRVSWTRIILAQYHFGNYTDAANDVEKLIAKLSAEQGATPIDELSNSAIGDMKRGLADLLVTEAGMDTDYGPSLSLLGDWKPLQPESPSACEKITDGGRR